MEKKNSMDSRKVNMAITLVQWLFLCALCMGSMMYVALHKTIVVSGEVRDQMHTVTENGLENMMGGRFDLSFRQQWDDQGSIRIPLMKDIKVEDVVVENHYMDRELWIYIEGADGSYYADSEITGDISSILSGCCEVQEQSIILKIKMNGMWEYYSAMEYNSAAAGSGGDNSMVITFREPQEVYDLIVVIDPMGGGAEIGGGFGDCQEKTLSLRIARLVSERMQQSDVKLYFTRQEDVDVSEEERLELLNASGADLYIRIAAGEDEDASVYGIYGLYNEEYFIPNFGNVQWADILTRNVTIASSNRALGIFPADEDSILHEITVPAAQINVGCLTNEQEAELLTQEAYLQRLAQGIADAVTEVYNSMQ